MNKDYTVTYIYHSCFCIEFENVVFIFDYFKGEIPKFQANKTIYFFASHKHYDHFDICIFDFVNKYKYVKYVLSDDIKLTDKYLERNNIPFSIRDSVISVGKNQMIDINDIHIGTLSSTDRGVAFIVKYHDETFYHGGDLNWWYKGHETKEYNNNMEKKYKTEMNKIKDCYFDIAFLPLDPRVDEGFYFGFDYFMKNTETKYAVPMHLWDDYNTVERFKNLETSNEYRDNVINISYENQVIL